MKIICLSLEKEFKRNFNGGNYRVFFIFLGLFWFVFLNNYLGLFPYIFTATRHLSVTARFALRFWITFILFGWINNINKIFSHLVPLGRPIFLASFIVLIETVRNLIRPITLSVRLAANIIAGHLLLTLLRNIRERNFFFFPIRYPVILCLIGLEIAVSVIQRYVYITLLRLYLNEV